MNRRRTRSSGLTLVEMSISLVILGVVLGSLYSVLQTANGAFSENALQMNLESRGARAIARAISALRVADQASVNAIPTPPLSAVGVTFQANEGYGSTEVGWSTPQRVEFDAAAGRLMLTRDPGLPSESEIPWGSGVPALLEGELANGLDDNGNGLIDEPGFCVVREGDVLVVRLTMQDQREDASVVTRTWTRRLYCRN